MGALQNNGVEVIARSRTLTSRPIGPSQRSYANAAVGVQSALTPPALLGALQGIEDQFGRRRSGQRWRARVLDLDVLLWSGGIWQSETLCIPHRHMRERDFVLGPAQQIAGDWRDPLSCLSVAQLHARLTRARPLGR